MISLKRLKIKGTYMICLLNYGRKKLVLLGCKKTGLKTIGQCSITAFLVQDIFGGLVYGVPLEDGNYHCFNVIGNIVFDLTSEQFGERKLDYKNVVLQKREDHFSKLEKYERYLFLKRSLLEKLR